MDQEVIRALKVHYCSTVLKMHIASTDAKKGIPGISIPNAVSFLCGACYRVTTAIVVNCFRKTGISTEGQQQRLDDANNPLQALASEIKKLRERYEGLILPEVTANE